MIRTSVILAFIVQAITLLVLLGWVFNIDFLIRPLSGSAAMNPVTALSLLFASTSFLLLSRNPSSKQHIYTGQLLAIITLFIGLIKIIDSSTAISIPVDRLLFPGKLGHNNVIGAFSADMALNSAISMVLMGIALLLVHVETIRSKMPGQFMALLICIASFLSILIYLFRVPDFDGSLRHIPMAIHTAICFQLLSIACVFVHPDKGMMKDFTSLYAGSIMARILVPAALVIPVILGFLRLALYWYGSITTELGVAVLVVSIILVFLTFIRFSINILNKKDYERELAEAELKKSRQRIQELFDTSPDAAVIVDQKGLIQMVNDQAVFLFQYQRQELIGQKVDMLLPEAMQASHQQHREQYIKNPHARPMGVGLELQALKKDGDTFPVEISLSPVQTEDGLMISASIRDVTERKKLEQRLKKFNEELERQVEIKTTEIKQS
ncbi:MAG TPA: PAS domain S-box protein, partial [Chitinophagaceae bacterium]